MAFSQSSESQSRRLNARELGFVNTIKARTDRLEQEAQAAAEAAPNFGQVTGYDKVTGQYNLATQNGGTIQARSESNSGVGIGQGYNLQSNNGLALPTFSSRPTIPIANTPATTRQQRGAIAATQDPNGEPPTIQKIIGRFQNDTYHQIDDSDPTKIVKQWSWDATAQNWRETEGGGGLELLTGDGTPPDSLGSTGDLYLDIGYPDDSSNTGTEALRLYFKSASYPSSTKVFWYQIGRRAVLGAPTRDPLFDGEMWTTRGGLTYTGWGGVWRRPNRTTTGPNPPDLKQVGDVHIVPTEVAGPPASEILCSYMYNGTEWALVGCCDDCSVAPPEEPYPDDYPIDCFGVHPEGPFRPYPDGTGGFVCTYKDPGLV